VLGVLDSRRSKLEIYLEVLNIIKNGTYKPTRIMYQANISWQPLMRVLGSMISQGLVDETDMKKQNRKRDKRTSKIYRITLKGEQVIRYFKGAKNFELDDINIPL
jgi:predicted transcriptional regulator